MSSKIRLLSPRLALTLAMAGLFASTAQADSVPQTLPFGQDWSNIGLITTSDDWSGVPGIIGYRGDRLTDATGTDPRTISADGSGTPLDVNANQADPAAFTTGGVTEFHLADPVVALTGSGTADAPFLLLSLNTTGHSGIMVRYDLRDLDGSIDNAVQPVALQYRVGSSGDFTNVPDAFVADATDGPSLAEGVTSVQATLPADADNQPLLQLRVITTNAPGNDEWVGVDNISVQGRGCDAVVQPIVTNCPALSLQAGQAGRVSVSASDIDSVVVGFSLTGTLPDGVTVDGFAPAATDGGSASAQVSLAAGTTSGRYRIGLRFTNDDGQQGVCSVDITVAAAAAVTPIFAIQGTGDVSPLVGQTVTTEGLVTRVIDNGFYLQNDQPDGDDASSEGISVFTGTAPSVQTGQRIRISATVGEFNTGASGNALTLSNTVTQLAAVDLISVLGNGFSVEPTVIAVMPEDGLERYEGMVVRIEGPITVSQNFFVGRFGQLTLSTEGRLEKPTNRHPAGSPSALAMARDNARRSFLLDDGLRSQNPAPIPFIGEDNTIRAGDTLTSLTGVVDFGLATSSNNDPADYRIIPIGTPSFVRSNPRPVTPSGVGGNIRVGSFNVLNYFTTFVDGTTTSGQSGAVCRPGGSSVAANCRGASNLAEFQRQKTKIVNAIAGLDADVVGLMEIQNNGNTAVNDLVSGLNARLGKGTYVSVPLPAGGGGGDAIRVAMIYKPAVLNLSGSPASDTNPVHSRPPLVQTFAARNGERFSVVVSHFKSKGSCPIEVGADADQGDGQGCWNALRIEQASALRRFVSGVQASSGDGDVLVIGDFNAYGKEDPVLEFTTSGYVDLIDRFDRLDEFGYSYVFDGEAGCLDHALATIGLDSQITGATHWRINADEPSVIDYNTEFKTQDLYAPTAFRSSDHDPVIVGLNLLRAINGDAGRDALNGTPGDDLITGGAGADRLTGGGGADIFVYVGLRDALDTITDFEPLHDRLDLRQLLASVGAEGDPLAGGHVSFRQTGAHTTVLFDADGFAGRAAARPLVILRNVSPVQLGSASFLY